jgi:mono/diheme cytochrome c family protein
MTRITAVGIVLSVALAASLAAQDPQAPASTGLSPAEHAALMKNEMGPASVALTAALNASNGPEAAKAAARLVALFPDVQAYWDAKGQYEAVGAIENAVIALEVMSTAIAANNMPAAKQADRMLLAMCETCHVDHRDRLSPASLNAVASGIWGGVYTEAQAKRGQEASGRSWCTSCHGSDLSGGEAPPLVGDDFLSNWNMETVGYLYERIQTTMPADKPGSLSPQDTADIVARVLQLNKFPAGQTELPSDISMLSKIAIGAEPPAK